MATMQMTLGSFLRDARADLRPIAITRAGGPDMGNLSKYERGERLPSVTTLKWLCEHYGVDFNQALNLLQQARLERDMAAVA